MLAMSVSMSMKYLYSAISVNNVCFINASWLNSRLKSRLQLAYSVELAVAIASAAFLSCFQVASMEVCTLYSHFTVDTLDSNDNGIRCQHISSGWPPEQWTATWNGCNQRKIPLCCLLGAKSWTSRPHYYTNFIQILVDSNVSPISITLLVEVSPWCCSCIIIGILCRSGKYQLWRSMLRAVKNLRFLEKVFRFLVF